METLTHGLEIELPLLNNNGTPYKAERALKKLAEKWSADGHNVEERKNPSLLIDIARKDNICQNSAYTAKIVAGYDCVASIIELAIGPYENLADLHKATSTTYNELMDIVAKDNASVLNFAELPNQPVSKDAYNKQALDKTFYYYMRDVRGFSHYVGVDGKTQLSPSTGIEIKKAMNALNLITKLSPLFIALYANSPFEEGKDTGVAENRLSLWEREFATSIFPQDKELYCNPKTLFTSWKHYFEWMYGRNIPFFALCADKEQGFKVNHELCYLTDAPDMMTFLRKDNWKAKDVCTHKELRIKPHIKDFIDQQFLLFSDARARYNFDCEKTSIKEFLYAFDKGPDFFEDYVAELFTYAYIENRVSGSCSPDRQLKEMLQSEEDNILKSVHISISALQAGILRNAEAIEKYLESIAYFESYDMYKDEAIKFALQGHVKGINIVSTFLEIVKQARQACNATEEKYFSYIEYSLEEKVCGADRARNLIKQHTHESGIDWKEVLLARNAIKYEEIV